MYAFAGWEGKRAVEEARRAWAARRRCRERFGIGTGYRRRDQARAWTTGRGVRYRLLLEGLAHLSRQVWVRPTEELARERRLRPTAWVGYTPAELLERLADHLKPAYRPTEAKLQPQNGLELGQAC